MFAIWFILQAFNNEAFLLVFFMGVIALLFNIVFLRESLYPVRWMSIGYMFMILFVIYPILFTIFIAFTNFGDGHLLNQRSGDCPTAKRAISYLKRVKRLAGQPSELKLDDYALWLD